MRTFIGNPLAILRRGRRPHSLREALRPSHVYKASLQPVALWSDPVLHPSNTRRLRRAERLEVLGLLDNDPHWRERLLVEGARFQTIHIGHSIQVEEGADRAYLLMSRSSARDHLDPEALPEQYAFLPLYFASAGGNPKGLPPRTGAPHSDVTFNNGDGAATANTGAPPSDSSLFLPQQQQQHFGSSSTDAGAAGDPEGTDSTATSSDTTEDEEDDSDESEFFDILD